MNENRRQPKIVLVAALISALASFVIYLPSLSFDFVNWDDLMYVHNNTAIRGLNLEAVFTSFANGAWIPVTLLSFSLDYAFWGLDPFGYHLSNAILHGANAFLVALLATRLASARGGLRPKALFIIALSAGLLFGLHPLKVESVAWVSERKDVLNAFFFLLGLHAYLSYARGRKALSYALTLVFFVLSLLSKPMTVTMPLVLLILDFYPLERSRTDGWKRLVLEKAPFFALSMATGLLNVWSHTVDSVIISAEALPLEGRLHITARGYLFYIYKTLIPVNLAPLYPRDFPAGLDTLFAVYVLALSAITALAVYLCRWSRVCVSVWAYFLMTLLPIIGILQVGMHAAADRFMYIPGIGFAMLASAGAGWAVRRRAKAFFPVLLAVFMVSAIFSAMTFRQQAVWKDSLTLWGRQIALYPDNAQGFKGRGTAHAIAGRYGDALEDFRKAADLDPSDSSMHIDLGKAYMHLGDGRNSYLSMKKAHELGDPAAYRYLKDLEAWGAVSGE
ncbi:MAG: hypothetical protein HS130_07835 [Deltaproteobacteria bacterium]|nr:hypothetical protein [Deltaproteobacteria bacterium]MCL4873078.1 hypothetical protein [bacterium]